MTKRGKTVANFKETDQKILQMARKLFSEKGILKTEMKDIARELGIGRSTLYRHYPGKEIIIYILADEAINTFMNATKIPEDLQFPNGYEELKWQFEAMVTCMVNHKDDVMFLRDFDCFFTNGYPEEYANHKEFVHYKEYVKSTKGRGLMLDSFLRGMEEGVIKKVENPDLVLLSMVHACFAMAQRVLPRESAYIEETGYSVEMVDQHWRLLVEAIKA